MAINIPPGAVGGGLLGAVGPALAEGIRLFFEGRAAREEEQRRRAEEARKRAIDDMAQLVQLHGPDVVNLPQFRDLYRQVFGREWPMVEQVIPAVTQKKKVQVGTKVMPTTTYMQQIKEGSTPSELRGIPAAKFFPVYGEVEEVVTPERREMVPAPLGGTPLYDPTAAEMGLPLPGSLSRLRLSQLKTLGFDIDTIIKEIFKTQDPAKLDDLTAQVTAKFLQDPKSLTPQDWALLQATVLKPKPTTLNEEILQKVIASGGDLSKLSPGERWYYENHILPSMYGHDYKKYVLWKATTKGLGSLNGVELEIALSELAKDKKDDYTLSDLKVDIALGRVPIEKITPEGRKLLGLEPGTPKADTSLYRWFQQKYNEAKANRDAAIAKYRNMIAQGRKHDDPEVQKVQDEIFRWSAATRVYRQGLERLESTMQGQPAAPTTPGGQPAAQAGATMVMYTPPDPAQYPNAVISVTVRGKTTQHRSVYRNGKWVWEPPLPQP